MYYKTNIPISKPFIGFYEYKYSLQSLLQNKIGGASKNNLICEKIISETVQHKYSKLTSNGTVALQIAFEAVKYKLNKEKLTIIIPNITFGATVNAALLSSNNVILADVDVQTGLISRQSVEKIIGEQHVDCICLVSLNGRLVKTEDLEYYTDHGMILIEDQAEAFASRYAENVRSEHIFMSTLSFYANKIVTCGEGGAVCFSDENIVHWVSTFINHGMSAPGTYQHELIGSNYRMSSYNAGLLRGQLSRIDSVIAHRRATWKHFSAEEHALAKVNYYSKGELPWLLEFKSKEPTEKLEKKLTDNFIQYRKYFSPMCDQPAFKDLPFFDTLQNSRKFIEGRYFLPLYYKMSKKHLNRIIEVLKT